MIKWEQIVLLGNPEFGTSLEPNIDFAAFARACGANGFTIENPKHCGDIVEEAFRTPGPAVVEAIVDPNEPPMPPKVTVKQAAHLSEALARGTRDEGGIIKTIIGDKVRELV
jgi:thiamine pyrophosphate-dependent acetolactate synthase large subunit-like protein